jgi:hypothetical protein
MQLFQHKNLKVYLRFAAKAVGVGNKFLYPVDFYKTIKWLFELRMDSVVILHKDDPPIPPKFIVLQSVSCTSLNNMSTQSIKSGVGSNVSSELVFSSGPVSPDSQQPIPLMAQSSMRTVYASSIVTPKRADNKLPQQPESPKQQCGVCCCCCY